MPDVLQVIRAAALANLACLGGQVQFRLEDGTCEAYWLNFDPRPQGPDEGWNGYVSRSAAEVSIEFTRLCEQTDFRAVAEEGWSFLRAKMETGLDPLEHLWFVLYFKEQETS